jgi:hypothetical protein
MRWPGRGEQQIAGAASLDRHPDREAEDVRCGSRWPDGSRLPCQHSVVSRLVQPRCAGPVLRPNLCSVPATTEPRGSKGLAAGRAAMIRVAPCSTCPPADEAARTTSSARLMSHPYPNDEQTQTDLSCRHPPHSLPRVQPPDRRRRLGSGPGPNLVGVGLCLVGQRPVVASAPDTTSWEPSPRARSESHIVRPRVPGFHHPRSDLTTSAT